MHVFSGHQRGATLLISLIMLVVLTLFALTGFNLSSVNLKIAGNFQQQRFIEAAIQQAVEQFVSTSARFNLTPTGQSYNINGINVTVPPPRCFYYTTATGESKDIGSLAPEDTVWEVTAEATDSFGGAKTSIVQGVQVRLLMGNCPPLI